VWRRLREWQEAGVWQRLHELLLVRLNEAERIDWSRAAIDSSHLRSRHAAHGRFDRRQPQRHHADDPARRRDPAVRGRRGRPRRRPRKLYGDRAYHSRDGRRELHRRGIQAKIAWPKSPHGSGLGKQRWVVERTIAWLHQYRRLRVRYERRDDIHKAFLAIGCSLICLKLLQAEECSNSWPCPWLELPVRQTGFAGRT